MVSSLTAYEAEGSRLGGRWYAVHTQPNREAVAEAHLSRQGFATFLPRHVKTLSHARQTRKVRAPLFARYLFVSIDIGKQRWRSVNGTIGVSRLVTFEDRPAPLPVGVVETLMASIDEHGCLAIDDKLKLGDTVRLIAGPFAESLGVLARMNGSGRVDLLMRLLNGDVTVNVSRDWVAPVLLN